MINIETYQESEDFKNLSLTEEKIVGVEFTDCVFENCNFENCKIIACQFTDCKFINCRTNNLKFDSTIMLDSIFEDCHLLGINWSTLFGGGYIVPIKKLKNCQLKYNNFLEINFARFDFGDNTITHSMFADCNLWGSSFVNTNLENTEFFRCDLTKSDFRNSIGYIIDISNNKLKGGKFSLPEAVNLLKGLGIVFD